MSLTYEIRDPGSPVTHWLHTRFPHHQEIQTAYRLAAGPVLVMPSAAVAAGTQGAAIDWWLRFILDPAPSLDLAQAGVIIGRRMPFFNAGVGLLNELGAEAVGGMGADDESRHMDPSRFRERPDEWWARVSYALALLAEMYRTRFTEGSRLMTLTPDSQAADLLALANDDEVTDLIAMRDVACINLLPALPAGPAITGMTFDGSADLSADADLIVDGVLVDFKASQGKKRTDGTRACGLARTDLDQLLGYTLMDYSDTYRMHTVAIYAARFGNYTAWPLQTLTEHLAGHPVDIAALRHEFGHLLRTVLPAYHALQSRS